MKTTMKTTLAITSSICSMMFLLKRLIWKLWLLKMKLSISPSRLLVSLFKHTWSWSNFSTWMSWSHCNGLNLKLKKLKVSSVELLLKRCFQCLKRRLRTSTQFLTNRIITQKMSSKLLSWRQKCKRNAVVRKGLKMGKLKSRVTSAKYAIKSSLTLDCWIDMYYGYMERRISIVRSVPGHMLWRQSFNDFRIILEYFLELHKTDLQQHMSTVHAEKNLACDQCDFATSKSFLLKKHKAEKHSGLTFSCDTCGVICSTAINLRTHIENMHMDRSIKCDQCERLFSTKAQLKAHVKAS